MKYLSLIFVLVFAACNKPEVICFSHFLEASASDGNASVAAQALTDYLKERKSEKPVIVRFEPIRYDFYPDGAALREYYISNHDQDNPKTVGFAFENLSNVTIDGAGADFIFHGRMLPVAIVNCNNVLMKNLSIDFELPHIRQLEVVEVDSENGYFTADVYPKGNYLINEDGRLSFTGVKYEIAPQSSMSFSKDGRLTYRRSVVTFNPSNVDELNADFLKIEGWQADVVMPGDRFVLRSYYRPTPGVFVSLSKDTGFENVTVHYAEGMGLLAQMSENFLLDGFNVALREGSRRVFTTQADATHFSACKGVIISRNGLYEGMADDAINVHGTYLKITDQLDNHTVIGRYMHHQAWGFLWGEPGDSVQFVQTTRMELAGVKNTIKRIEPYDCEATHGAREFLIVFSEPLGEGFRVENEMAVENLTWTPEVVFSNNVVRNNRARGVLFSTPKRVICEHNLFDHTHGTAILLCGDANGWYETGACREVIIRGNRFVNALTAYYQFTNAVISIYPEIPDLAGQTKYFHSGIVIEDNLFETFDRPLVYAKSVDGLIFRNNRVVSNMAFEPFHWNTHRFFFERVNNVEIHENAFDFTFNPDTDLRIEKSAIDAVVIH
ncbi:alpha-1,3-galactosidase-related protein [Alkaliflexus imshenetskii]|uniref:alpha-1,3-galactosidase-related protein n=1 Tax=Alkaliflexus imshenetskii TaxID=286730 RepID=UPI00047E4D2C|nr:alpha-1,3-galactosidase B [Alkaliflexus imshenetskii]